ncbi:DUF4129 domain-containing protein [Salinicoccus halodurans]|uniref:DUF4129 domain-containing protein n=1 Tax=Salinicoccus halodurans TaxID=407035 RepID=A0A0F7HIX2_9STAP|nr:DUF4129 domain-containing protein [Salinicoccus halodurans]AKG72942.1 hypothetical protein AAT16_01115 [Salinicoccus halodurans]SFK76484.1 hypothetical protein SAMN05216235_1595 [Salinicoccus halodurans]
MKRLKYICQFSHTYLTDMFLLLFIVLLLNVHNGKEALILPFITLVVLMMIVSFFIVSRFRPVRIYFMLPVVLIVALGFGFNWLAALLVAYLPIWRLEYLHDDVDNSFSKVTLIVTFLLLIATNVLTTEATIAYSPYFHLIFLSLIIFFFTGRIIVHLIGNGYPTHENCYMFTILSAPFILIGVFLGLMYHYIVFAAKYTVVLLLNGFIFLLRPFFHMLENVEIELPELEKENVPEGREGEEVQPEFDQTSAFSQMPADTILATLFIIAVIAVLYVYYKKRNKPSVGKNNGEMNSSASIFHSKNKIKREIAKAPDSRVRRVYFEFEKWLASKNLGRYHNETITEWIQRLGLNEIIDKERLSIYMETRYRDAEVTDDEYRRYKENIRSMKKDITTYLKNH